MDNSNNLMEQYINNLIKDNNKNAIIYLVNGIKLQGHVSAIDMKEKCIMVSNGKSDSSQLIFLHAIATISSQ